MKRCPECRRDYYDQTLLYCLDDGTALLEGPSSGVTAADEPATAMLHSTSPQSESPTITHLHTTIGETSDLESLGNTPRAKSIFAHRMVKPLAGVVVATAVLAGAFFLAGDSNAIDSIAVMPFVRDGGSSEIEYLSDGMTETLIKNLSQLPNLAVKSRSTVFYYKGKETSPQKLGEELNVKAVLLGRVGVRGNDLRLNLELVDTRTQNVIWSEQYDRKQSDLVSLQSEIAKDVSTKLRAKVSGGEITALAKPATTDPEAYQAYLKGRYYWNRRTAENIRKAIEQFESATRRDPNYALAYAGLADCFGVLNQYAGAPTSETLPKTKEYAESAIAIDAQLAEPHASLGQAHHQSWQWADAEREYKKALELNPNYATAYHWYSLLLKDLGRWDESAVMIRRARDLDPLSSVIGINISEMYHWQNDHAASIRNSLKLLELDPSYADAYNVLGISYSKLGKHAEAITSLEKGAELSGRAAYALTSLGYAYSVAGRRKEAYSVAKELEEKYAKSESSGQYIAGIYAGLGEKDKALEWLERDFRAKAALTEINWSIPFESLRDDARFKDLRRRMNLPE